MKTEGTILPPETTPPPTSGKTFFLYIRLKLPAIPGFTHEGARLATLLLSKLIESKLQLAGVTYHSVGASGDFNDSIYLVQVSPLAPAIEATKAAFVSVGLAGLVEIGWFDDWDDVLRTEHPAKAARLFPHEEIEALNAASVKFITELNAALEQFREKQK